MRVHLAIGEVRWIGGDDVVALVNQSDEAQALCRLAGKEAGVLSFGARRLHEVVQVSKDLVSENLEKLLNAFLSIELLGVHAGQFGEEFIGMFTLGIDQLLNVPFQPQQGTEVR